MSVVSSETNEDDLSVSLVADFGAPIERVWELWADPRQLERWWGPPGYPASVQEHDLVPGGQVTYSMTGPGGERHRGLWRVTAVDPPTRLDFADVFADADGSPAAGMPVANVAVRLAERAGGTRMEMRTEFESREDLERWLETGTREAQRQAVARMEALLR